MLSLDICSAVHTYTLNVRKLFTFSKVGVPRYWCTKLTNNINFATNIALRVTKPMKNVKIPETQVATFECEISHFNVPSIWLKNKVEIEMSEKFVVVVQGKLHQLKVINATMDDAGEYTFVCGKDSISAELIVRRKSDCSFFIGLFVAL